MSLVLVHGWMVTERVWSRLLPLLSSAHCIAPRLRIAGSAEPSGSELASLTLDALAADVLEAARAAGVDRFHLVGHSMGGQIAQRVAATAPERVQSLSLVNAVPISGLPLPREVAEAFRRSGGDRTAQAAILDQACRELSAEAKEALLEDAASIAPGWISRAFDVFTTGGDASTLASIACPTSVIATDDPFLPPAFLEQTLVAPIRGAKLEVIRGPGHYPQVERPEALASVLLSFIGGAA